MEVYGMPSWTCPNPKCKYEEQLQSGQHCPLCGKEAKEFEFSEFGNLLREKWSFKKSIEKTKYPLGMQEGETTIGYVTKEEVECKSCGRTIRKNELQYDSPEGRICLNCDAGKQPRQTTPEIFIEGDKKNEQMKSEIWGIIVIVAIGAGIAYGMYQATYDLGIAIISMFCWLVFCGLVLLWDWAKKRKKRYEILKEAEEKDRLGRGEKKKNE